jgi:hypothetical protein
LVEHDADFLSLLEIAAEFGILIPNSVVEVLALEQGLEGLFVVLDQRHVFHSVDERFDSAVLINFNCKPSENLELETVLGLVVDLVYAEGRIREVLEEGGSFEGPKAEGGVVVLVVEVGVDQFHVVLGEGRLL